MSLKTTNIPAGLRTRDQREDLEAETKDSPPESLENRNTSNKTGSHSTVEKLAASRSQFAPRSGTAREPRGENEFRCNACGRYFDAESDLRGHEVECRAAKQATHAGTEEMEMADKTTHAPNDRGR